LTSGFGAARLLRGGLKLLGIILVILLLALAGFRVAAALRERGAPSPARMTMVATPLGRVAVSISGPGDGRTVLLVHGTAAWSGFWKQVSAHLAANGWRVIAVDMPPFGWSDRDPQRRYDRVSQARRLSALVAAMGRESAVVVGHSFGAGATTELALRHPEQVRSLVLVDAALGTPDEARTPGLAKLLRFRPLGEMATSASISNPLATGPLLRSFLARKDAAGAWLPLLRQPMRRQGTTAAYAAWLPSLFDAADGALSRRSAALAGIRVPVALIWGQADTITPLGQGRRIARLTRARSFALLAGVGHIPHIEDPPLFLKALDAAIAPDRKGHE
jgi:pimeloyl-ACP methyl ester carboxylesterase